MLQPWQVLAGAFAMCYRHPGRFIVPAALAAVPGMLLSILYIQDVHGRNASVGVFEFALVIVSIVLGTYLECILPVLTAHTLDGRTLSWTHALTWARKMHVFWGVLGVSLLYAFAVLCGLLLLVVPGIIFSALFLCAIPARVLGDFRSGNALSESKRLMRPVLWKGALTLAIILLIPFLASLLLDLFNTVTRGFASYSSAAIIRSAIWGVLSAVLIKPVVGVALSLVYITRTGGVEALRPDVFESYVPVAPDEVKNP